MADRHSIKKRTNYDRTPNIIPPAMGFDSFEARIKSQLGQNQGEKL